MQAINPATGKLGTSYPELPEADVPEVLDRVHEAFLAWRTVGFDERARRMKAAAAILRRRSSELARLCAEEMGKPVTAGKAEVEKCAVVCEFYADHAPAFLKNEPAASDARKSYITFQPIGIVLAVMPWNFPFWQVFRFAAPALMAGNAAVLKHASNVPGCALAIERVFHEAEFPNQLFRTLLISSRQVDQVIQHPQVRAVTLTGSEAAGRAVARSAGQALKKTVLELGGSDPYVILEDAELEATVLTCVTSRLINTGQSCIAAKRFIVVEPVRRKFEELFVERMRQEQPGDPLDERTSLGPLARVDLRDELHRQVQASVEAGATCLLGGKVPAGPGAYYPPTVLAAVTKGMPAYEEELFGPVASIIPAVDQADAIRIANDTPYGLGAAVFTRDEQRGERLAATELNAGCCFVNAFVKSDPRLPFGGIKASGYGRELSHFGIKEFVNVKTVYVK